MRAVVWSQPALDDFDAEIAYITRDDPRTAEVVAERIRVAADNLSFAAIGRPGRVGGTYEKVVAHTRYIIAYMIEDDLLEKRITILRVIHTSRRWPEGQWPK